MTRDAERQLLRARVFLRSVLPLLKVVMEDEPAMARLFAGVSAKVQLETQDAQHGACLCFEDGVLSVEPQLRAAAEVQLRWVFRDLSALNSFFAGKPVLPRIIGLRRPRLLWKTIRLLSSLRILHPQRKPARIEQRRLRVKLLLYLVTHALAQLARGGHAQMNELVQSSPERVYQWTVASANLGAYLRMQRGRIKAGRGTYPHRRPFVHFYFPDVDAALAVLTASGSQMTGLRDGQVQTFGSPEYTRKISLLMQKVDALLVEG
jgi:hypothetical protein